VEDISMNTNKVPDKIYVHVRTEPKPSITFSEVIEKNSTNEEYIRKDALLEWIEALKSQTMELREEGCGDVFYGAQIAILEEIIHKIVSL